MDYAAVLLLGSFAAAATCFSCRHELERRSLNLTVTVVMDPTEASRSRSGSFHDDGKDATTTCMFKKARGGLYVDTEKGSGTASLLRALVFMGATCGSNPTMDRLQAVVRDIGCEGLSVSLHACPCFQRIPFGSSQNRGARKLRRAIGSTGLNVPLGFLQ